MENYRFNCTERYYNFSNTFILYVIRETDVFPETHVKKSQGASGDESKISKPTP